MTERMKFVARYLEGERISDLSREFGISRQTGHALVKRYELFGSRGLLDASSRPHRSPNRTAAAKVVAILDLRRKRPTWGPKKLKERLQRLQPDVVWPATSTIGAILADAGESVQTGYLVDWQGPRRSRSPQPNPCYPVSVSRPRVGVSAGLVGHAVRYDGGEVAPAGRR